MSRDTCEMHIFYSLYVWLENLMRSRRLADTQTSKLYTLYTAQHNTSEEIRNARELHSFFLWHSLYYGLRPSILADIAASFEPSNNNTKNLCCSTLDYFPFAAGVFSPSTDPSIMSSDVAHRPTVNESPNSRHTALLGVAVGFCEQEFTNGSFAVNLYVPPRIRPRQGQTRDLLPNVRG